MFWNRKKKNLIETHEPGSVAPSVVAMRKTIANQEQDDKLLRAKITGKEITTNILEMVKDERGVRIETALGVLGSMAGFTTSYAMMHEVMRGILKVEMPEVVIATLKSGDDVMFGDYINRKLVEGELIGGQNLSLWAMVAGKAQQLGATPTFDIMDVFSRVSKSIGTPEFGVLQVADQHHPGDTPQEYVSQLFAKFLPILGRYELPVDQYFLAFALSAQELIEMGKEALAPDIACQIVMECAVPASKLDPRPYFSTPT